MTTYIGRFAPSPTGALHLGSLVAALASWLDARAHEGKWLVRIEDLDTPRCVPGAIEQIMWQLAACGLVPDEPPLRQSARVGHYQSAQDILLNRGYAYPCACSRRDIEEAMAANEQPRPRHTARIYPGTCRSGLKGRPGRATRVRTCSESGGDLHIVWTDRRLGRQAQNLTQAVGDFVIHRADGLWAYQLGVVVDDAAQHVTHVVRGEDLADNTPRQIHLQTLLNLSTPAYLHTPLVLGANGEKLSKQNSAPALELHDPVAALQEAGLVLGLPRIAADSKEPTQWLREAVRAWRERW